MRRKLFVLMLVALAMMTNLFAQQQQDQENILNLAFSLLESQETPQKDVLNQVNAIAQQAIKAGNPEGYAVLALYQSSSGKEKKSLATIEKGYLLGSINCLNIITNYYLNNGEAEKLFKLYKKKNDAEAKRRMARMIMRGYVGEQSAADLQNALSLYNESANEGDVQSMLSLSRIYTDANYGVKNDQLALGFLNRYLAAGGADANYYLGAFYANQEVSLYNVNKALEYYQKAADEGDADAIFEIGMLYFTGWDGNAADTAKSIELFKTSADKGCANAAMTYAGILMDGMGIPVDSNLAFQYVYQAAQGGNGAACGLIGKFFFEGTHDYERNVDSAFHYFEIGSQEDDPYCDYMLGKRLHDFDQYGDALRYFASSMNHGNLDAAYYYARISLIDGIDNTEEGYQIMKQLAEEYRYPDAFMELGVCYAQGHAVEQSLEKAFVYFDTADNLGSRHGTYNLGICYLNGYGCTIDTAASLRCMEKAASLNHTRAMQQLALFYEGKKDYTQAVEWYQKGVDLQDGRCMIGLADCYKEGNGVVLNSQKAFELYNMASENGNKEGTYQVAWCYVNGIGVEENIITAVEWFEKAADKGSLMAYYMLGEIYAKGETDSNGNKIEADKKKAIEYLTVVAQYEYEPAIAALEKLTKKKKK